MSALRFEIYFVSEFVRSAGPLSIFGFRILLRNCLASWREDEFKCRRSKKYKPLWPSLVAVG